MPRLVKFELLHQITICEKLYKKHKISSVLDLGAGTNPQRNICSELGISQLLIDLGYPEMKNLSSVRRSIDILDFTSIESAIVEFTGLEKVDCVVSIGNIEHLDKDQGRQLLSRVESWSNRLVIFETPNGFVHQGPVGGNIYQIHKSGWSPREFRERGYKVYGTTGLKILKKNSDKGAYRFPFRGMRLLDVLLSKLLFLQYFPALSFNFLAVKIIK